LSDVNERSTVRRRPTEGLVLAAAALAASVAGRAVVPAVHAAAPPPRPVVLRAAPSLQAPASAQAEEELTRAGEEAIVKVCVECHSFDDIVVLRRSPKEWKDVVTQMATKGAVATESQFAVIRAYLTRFYGRVPVNSAAAADLAAVLGISAAQADAIVAYRAAHGKFTDLPALLKVPGVDAAKIEDDPDALKFD
jgi:competence ComEA-like helix-hairpin-helix protein